MPSGVYVRTELNRTGFKKGCPPLRTKESYTNDEYRKKLSKSLQKRWDSGTRSKNTNKGSHWKVKDTSKMKGHSHIAWNKGVPMSNEAKEKERLSHKGINTWMKGKKRTL